MTHRVVFSTCRGWLVVLALLAAVTCTAAVRVGDSQFGDCVTTTRRRSTCPAGQYEKHTGQCTYCGLAPNSAGIYQTGGWAGVHYCPRSGLTCWCRTPDGCLNDPSQNPNRASKLIGCPAGFTCKDGKKTACPAGTYRSRDCKIPTTYAYCEDHDVGTPEPKCDCGVSVDCLPCPDGYTSLLGATTCFLDEVDVVVNDQVDVVVTDPVEVETERDASDNIGLYLGIGASAVALVGAFIAVVKCCCKKRDSSKVAVASD